MTGERGMQSSPLLEITREDLGICREARIHWLTVAIPSVVLTVTAVGLVTFSAAFGAEMTLTGFVEILTVNAAWLFFSLVALMGLFVAVPFRESLRSQHRFKRPTTRLLGVLLSRWILVGGGLLVGFLGPLVVGLLFFDAVSPLLFIGVVVLTVLVGCAWTAVGVALAAVSRSDSRLVLWLLTVYWVVVFLFETSVVPLFASLAAGADPETVIGTPPLLHDLILAATPGGAHAIISAALMESRFGGIEVFALGALGAWLVVPPIVAIAWRQRRASRWQA